MVRGSEERRDNERERENNNKLSHDQYLKKTGSVGGLSIVHVKRSTSTLSSHTWKLLTQ